MDVKSSWRKAVQEDEAKERFLSTELNDSITGRLCPDSQLQNISPDAPSHTASRTPAPTLTAQSSSSVCQQRVFLKSSLLWDTFNNEAHDNPSGTSMSALQFSLHHETLPEMASCDSLNLEDEAVDMTSEEDEEVLIPSLKAKLKQTLLTSPHRGSNKVPLMESAGTAEDESVRRSGLKFDKRRKRISRRFSLRAKCSSKRNTQSGETASCLHVNIVSCCSVNSCWEHRSPPFLLLFGPSLTPDRQPGSTSAGVCSQARSPSELPA
ncbi:hypothetical protein XENOCAPTIV_022565 [Xenoophorus captivus]|uniref:Uncharacterized protein n=1 Tax=Xenoophorus captivus TaxID=1517983 RepID=A0ABV0R4M4_9TELE